MSENNDQQEVKEEDVGTVTVTIQLDMNTNKIRIDGPMNYNPVLFLGMLEMAKLTLTEMRSMANKKYPPEELVQVADFKLPMV